MERVLKKSKQFFRNLPGSYSKVSEIIDSDDTEAYRVVKVFCTIGGPVHVFFLVFFLALGVFPLAIFNVGSIAAWGLTYYFNEKGKIATALSLAAGEVLAHAIFCVFVLGWEAGFQYYIIATTVGMFCTQKLPGRSLMITALVGGLIASYFIGQVPALAHQLAPALLRIIYIVNLVITFAVVLIFMWSYSLAVHNARAALKEEHKRVEKLLHNILPVPIATRLKEGGRTIADRFENTTVFFCDIADFTRMSERLEPSQLVEVLNEIFCLFDRGTEKHGLEKIKTIGDSYMAAAGIPEERGGHAEAVADFAVDMLAELEDFNQRSGWELSMRVGMNSGPLVAGIIGEKKFIYDLWGDTVNVASRMESTGIPGQIQVTESTYDLLRDRYHFRKRGLVEVKGKGPMMTYFLVSRERESKRGNLQGSTLQSFCMEGITDEEERP